MTTFVEAAFSVYKKTIPKKGQHMINTVIFDLDGTLVKTEKLKALSYARAMTELRPDCTDEEEAIEAFKEVVGRSRQQVAKALMQRFDLEKHARARMAEFEVRTPWQAFVQIRLRYYNELLANPDVLRENQWPHNMALLQHFRQSDCKVGLATMSVCSQVKRVLSILDLADAFDFIASRDDVEHGKPEPEIYLLVAKELDSLPGECLVIEDSPSGVKSALAAGMWCIAVSTPFTHRGLHAKPLLDPRWMVDDPRTLPAVVQQLFAAANQ
jgi:HAD superfamily hydrolase (TIGR01509 family)